MVASICCTHNQAYNRWPIGAKSFFGKMTRYLRPPKTKGDDQLFSFQAERRIDKEAMDAVVARLSVKVVRY